MVGLAQTANNLESVSDVVTTKLVSLGQQRIAEGIDLTRLRDESTSRFVSAVMRNLEQAIQTIDQPNASDMTEVIAAKREIEDLAAATRKSLMEKLQLADKKDVQTFRLATDMIEQCKQIAYFARRIVRDYETVVTQQIDG
jgi:phosphate:Na+ symporter